MKEYIPLLSALVGGIIGFLASFISNRQAQKFQIASEQRAFKRKKREDLYYVSAKLRKEYSELEINCLGRTTVNEPLNRKETGEISNWDELSMIVYLYFPELNETLGYLFSVKNKVGEVLAEVLTFKSTSKSEIQKINGKIVVAFALLDKEFASFQEKISKSKDNKT